MSDIVYLIPFVILMWVYINEMQERLKKMEKKLNLICESLNIDETQVIIPDEKLDEIKNLIKSNNKIKAVKLYRNLTGEGLKESKEFIDSLSLELQEQK